MKALSQYDTLALIASLCFIAAGIAIAYHYEQPATYNLTLMAASMQNLVGHVG